MIPRLASGVVLGKFLPPHAGHVYLIGMALRQVERLVVVVERIDSEPIAAATRVDWLRALVPDAEIALLDRLMPQHPAECANFWPRWREALRDALPLEPQVVFASEAYGHRLADELEARFLPIDPSRQVLPISASTVRASPEAHARFLPAIVREHYGIAATAPLAPATKPRHIALVGPESSGKSTLARELAEQNGGLLVPEVAQRMIATGVSDPLALTARDFSDFARGQAASEDTLAALAKSTDFPDLAPDWLFCDSDALTTSLYAGRLLGACPAWIEEEARQRRYALTLLCAPDLPWQPDVHRVDRAGRARIFGRFEERLATFGRPTVVIRGHGRARVEQALRALSRSALPRA